MGKSSAHSRVVAFGVLFLLVAALPSCGLLKKKKATFDDLPQTSAPDPDSGMVDAGDQDAGDAAAEASSPLAGTPTTSCRKTLKVGTLHSSGGITDKDLTTGSIGTLFVPCGGAAGPARAVFGRHQFSGTVSAAGNLSVATGSVYTAFGCPWQTSQTIAGVSPNLHFHYGEKPQPPCKSSARPTILDGPITVQ